MKYSTTCVRSFNTFEVMEPSMVSSILKNIVAKIAASKSPNKYLVIAELNNLLTTLSSSKHAGFTANYIDWTKKRKRIPFPDSFIKAFKKAYDWYPKFNTSDGYNDSQVVSLVEDGKKPIGWVDDLRLVKNSEVLDFKPTFSPDRRTVIFLPENRDIAEAWIWFSQHVGSVSNDDEWNFIRGVLLGYPIDKLFGRTTAVESLKHLTPE